MHRAQTPTGSPLNRSLYSLCSMPERLMTCLGYGGAVREYSYSTVQRVLEIGGPDWMPNSIVIWKPTIMLTRSFVINSLVWTAEGARRRMRRRPKSSIQAPVSRAVSADARRIQRLFGP